MKWMFVLALMSSSVFAADINLSNISKNDLKDISNELGANFAHTVVAAPETNGLWGVEVGVVGGTTKSDNLKKVINRNGGDGNDFDTLPHGGLFARGHFPLELFLELSMIPEVKASDAELSSGSLGVGWNFGEFFTLPFDLAIGYNMSKSNFEYKQLINGFDSKVEFKNKTDVFWLGISEEFLGLLTPYAKIGTFSTKSDVDVTSNGGTIFGYTAAQKDSVSSSGAYYAVGLNFQLTVIRLGIEAAKTNDVSSLTGKLALAF